MDVNGIEILQGITLAFVGFVWTEIRTIRKDVADARERLHSLETMDQARERRELNEK